MVVVGCAGIVGMTVVGCGVGVGFAVVGVLWVGVVVDVIFARLPGLVAEEVFLLAGVLVVWGDGAHAASKRRRVVIMTMATPERA